MEPPGYSLIIWPLKRRMEVLVESKESNKIPEFLFYSKLTAMPF
jgi:hypothetical protein